MALNADGKWVVQTNDCLWKIAQACYGDASRWPEIAKANGVSLSTAIIHTGQVLTIPGVTSSSGSGTTTTVPPEASPVQDDSKYLTPKTNQTVGIVWWKLNTDQTRQMFCAWEFDRANTDHYEINVWEDREDGYGWRVVTDKQTVSVKEVEVSASEYAKKIKIGVKPISQEKSGGGYYWTDGKEVTLEYDFRNNPPEMPPAPSFSIDEHNKVTVEFQNIQETINADYIEFWFYQDTTLKYRTGMTGITSFTTISLETGYAYYETTVDAGHKYQFKYRAARSVQNGEETTYIYGSWSEFTEIFYSSPIAPQIINSIEAKKFVDSEHGTFSYGVLVKWDKVESAKYYRVEYSDYEDFHSYEYADSEPDDGPQLLIMNIGIGDRYYFRVRSINDGGISEDWSESKLFAYGTKPAAPTTYSNVLTCNTGEDLKLYWIHNSTDGSVEEYARIQFVVTDFLHPDVTPFTFSKIIPNERPTEERSDPGVYVINLDDEEWSSYTNGFLLKWRVQTCGVSGEYSNFSIEREARMFIQPTITIDIKEDPNSQTSLEEISQFPFYILGNVLPKITQESLTQIYQIPLSYHIEIVSKSDYDVPDRYANTMHVSIGDIIYSESYDPDSTWDDKWKLVKEMTPSDITLQNGAEYTLTVTVSMSSGLTASDSLDFSAQISDVLYNVYADVIINKETLEANIHPYCYEYLLVEDPEPGQPTTEPQLVQNCRLSVYRKEYNGKFVEIASDIDNTVGAYVTDPHPALDYARYRIVARNNNGSINFADINPVKVGEPSIIIQWSEAWSKFQTGDIYQEEPAWSGSMIKIPYNIDVSENNNMDTSLIEYVGREHPVSYYGTQLGTTANWNCEIPAYDKEMIYNLRRLSAWTGDVYVREPSGTGYWANISVSFNIAHNAVTIPVSFSISRVEGGI